MPTTTAYQSAGKPIIILVEKSIIVYHDCFTVQLRLVSQQTEDQLFTTWGRHHCRVQTVTTIMLLK